MRTCSLETAFLRRTMAMGVGDQRKIQSRSDLIRSNRKIKLDYIAKCVRYDVDRGRRNRNLVANFYEFYDFEESDTDVLTSQCVLLKLNADSK